MTTASPPAPRTALAVLFGPGAGAPGMLARHLAGHGGLGRALEGLPAATREAAERQVAAAASGLLDVDLMDLLVAGWRTYQELVSAARRTLEVPDSVELVQLARHQVTVTQQPYVTVLVDDHRVATVNLELSAVFDVVAALAEVCAGTLMAVQAGYCDITVTLAIEGADALSRQTRLDLPGVIHAGQGIRLLPARDYQDGAAQPAQ